MKSYDWGVFLLILSAVLANIVSTQAAGELFFCYLFIRVVYSAIFNRR